MPKLNGNRLGIAADVDRILGSEPKSLRAGAFGCRHNEATTRKGELAISAVSFEGEIGIAVGGGDLAAQGTERMAGT
jgi:hypothetical protein